MASFRIFVALSVFLGASLAQNCDQTIQTFQTCLKNAHGQQGGQGGQGGAQPDFQAMKLKADKCFKDNGCTEPQMGPGGPGGQGGPGGRAGPKQGGQGGNQNNKQCFDGVRQKTRDYVQQCVRKTDPGFTLPAQQEHGGFEHHDGGFGGGDHDGQGGKGGKDGPGGKDGEDRLLKACNNDQNKATAVKTCLKAAFPKQEDNQQKRQQVCQARQSCKSSLTPQCEQVLETRRKATCNCNNEAHSKRQEFVSSVSSCSGVQQKAGQNKARDCNAAPRDPCQGQG